MTIVAGIGRSLAYLILLGVVFWLPLPLASNRPWFWIPVLALTALALLLALVFRHRPDPEGFGAAREFRLPFLLFRTVVAVSSAAMRTPAGRGVVPAGAAKERTVCASIAALGRHLPGRHAQPHAGRAVPWLNGFLFLLVMMAVQDRGRLRWLCRVILAAGLLQCLVALLILWRFPEGLLWMGTLIGDERVSGSYVNRNHFGLFLVLCLGIGLGMARHAGRGMSGGIPGDILSRPGGRLLLVSGVNLVLFIALLYSNSRGAFLSFLASLITVRYLLRRPGEPVVNLKSLAVLVVLLIPVIFFFGEGGFSAVCSRPAYWRRSVYSRQSFRCAWRSIFCPSAPAPAPMAWSFPCITTKHSASWPMTTPHNDYLEVLVEAGPFGLLMLLAAVVLVLQKAAPGVPPPS